MNNSLFIIQVFVILGCFLGRIVSVPLADNSCSCHDHLTRNDITCTEMTEVCLSDPLSAHVLCPKTCNHCDTYERWHKLYETHLERISCLDHAHSSVCHEAVQNPSLCHSTRFHSWCAKTCRFVEQPPICRDHISKTNLVTCEELPEVCNDPKTASVLCPKYCGLCNGTEMEDYLLQECPSACEDIASHGYCQNLRYVDACADPLAHKFCQRSCEHCKVTPSQTTAIPTTSFQGTSKSVTAQQNTNGIGSTTKKPPNTKLTSPSQSSQTATFNQPSQTTQTLFSTKLANIASTTAKQNNSTTMKQLASSTTAKEPRSTTKKTMSSFETTPKIIAMSSTAKQTTSITEKSTPSITANPTTVLATDKQTAASTTGIKPLSLSTVEQSKSTTVKQAGLNTTKPPNLSTVEQPKSTTVKQAGLNTTQQPNLSTETQPKSTTVKQAGLNTTKQPNLSTETHPISTTVKQAGLNTTKQLNLSTEKQTPFSSTTKTTTTTTEKLTTTSTTESTTTTTKQPTTLKTQNLPGQKCVSCGDYASDTPCSDIELLLADTTDCGSSAPYCMNDIYIKGHQQTIIQRCAGQLECQKLWFLETSDNPICQHYSPTTKSEIQDLTCHFCCYGDQCNHNLLPEISTRYSP